MEILPIKLFHKHCDATEMPRWDININSVKPMRS